LSLNGWNGKRGSVSQLSVNDTLLHRARSMPESVALVSGDTSLTFGALNRMVDAVADGMSSRWPAGSLIALRFELDDWGDYAVAYLASHRARMSCLALPASLAGLEASSMVNELSVTAIVGTSNSRIDLGMERLTVDEVAAAPAGTTERRGGLASEPDLVDIFYTSGTSGLPKAVSMQRDQLHFAETLPVRGEQRQLAAIHVFAPGSFVGTHVALLSFLSRGIAQVAMGWFQPLAFLQAMDVHRPSTVLLVPAMTRVLVRAATGHHLAACQRVTLVSLSGDASEPSLLEDCTRLFPNAAVMSVYGLTEAGTASVWYSTGEGRERWGSRPPARAWRFWTGRDGNWSPDRPVRSLFGRKVKPFLAMWDRRARMKIQGRG
jgi:acyl-CoA synthetase (AMP-forming)/AMP-acid ligase II